MRSFLTNKFWVILVSSIALGALMGLAIGLRGVSFRDAQVFGRNEARAVGSVSLDVINSVLSIPLQTQLLVWILFVLIFVLIGFLLSPEMRKRLIQIAIRVAVTYWALYILFTRYRDVLAQMALNLASGGNLSSSTVNSLPPPEFTPPRSVSWISYFVSFAMTVLLVFVVWKAYTFWKEIKASDLNQPLKKLAKIARSSLDDLSSGRNSTDVIVNCYFRMSDVVADKRKLHRKAAMTPAEFAVQLVGAGLPAEAVQRLTRLFESVRYGERKTELKDVNEAVSCLTTILHHCEEPV